MSDNTKISWANATWNPVTGCTEVSPGCAHCYAKTFAERWRGIPGHYFENGFDVTLRPAKLAGKDTPLAWTKPRRIFVNSMSDLFHEDVDEGYIDNCFAVMALCRQHTFQILTKRIERAVAYLEGVKADWESDRIYQLAWELRPGHEVCEARQWPLPNVIIGPTVENQHFADVRLPVLQRLHDDGWRTMVSYEPALGPVDWPAGMTMIDWLICGGESGPGRRPFDLTWAYSAQHAAKVNGVPFFMKQDGGPHTEMYDHLPEDLKVREFPKL